EKQALEKQVTELEQSVENEVLKVNKSITELQAEQAKLRVELSKIESAEKSKARIAELEQEEKELASEFEELEHQLYLTEEFTRTKVDMLTENINEKFKYARFNLFREQVNGGLDE